MADGSPLPFPSPSVILGLDSASSDEPAVPPEPPPARPKKHAKRPSNSGKENTKRAAAKKGPTIEQRNAAGEGEGKDLSQVKPKQTKSRNGCATCKLKRLKCGEEKPGCLQCAKRNITCGGYKKVFQWREFPNNAPAAISSPLRANISTSTSPIAEVPSQATDQPNTDAKTSTKKPPTPPPTHTPRLTRNGEPTPRAGPSASASPLSHHHSRQDSKNLSAEESLSGLSPEAAGAHGSGSTSFNPDIVLSHRTRSMSSVNGRGASPSFTQYMQDELLQDLPNENHAVQDFVTFSMPQDLDFPYLTSGHDPVIGDEDFIDLIGPIQPTDFPLMQWPSEFSTPNSPYATGTPENQLAFWNSQSPPFFQQPDVPLRSDEFLLDHFNKMTCGVLSVMDGPTENPWRMLVLPMASHSEALYHALLAMTAFHAAADYPQLKVVGGEHKQASIRHISDGIRDDSMGIQTKIATALALTFAESWDQHTTTGVMHIKGASALVQEALHRHTVQPLDGVDLARLKFLCNAWVYLDVIARLTGVDCDEKDDFAFNLWTDGQCKLVTGHMHPGFGLNFGLTIDARLDPLMGCAGTLFPKIGYVANLVRKVCRSQRNTAPIISVARDLMAEIQEWTAPAYVERPEDPATDVQHALQTAEAYRYATLLHLHQAVPELPSEFSDDNYAQRVLQYLATVPLSSKMLNIHVYPLMVAGCMASEAEDRDWVRGRWDVMRKRMRTGVIEKCLKVTEEVWRRKDDYEAKSPRQRNLVVTSTLSPAHRRAGAYPEKTGSQSPEPGRAGMIFSFVDPDNEATRGTKFDDRTFSNGQFDVAYTVRGHLHWVGVLWDWAWEVLLG